jgi:hypothetical protein
MILLRAVRVAFQALVSPWRSTGKEFLDALEALLNGTQHPVPKLGWLFLLTLVVWVAYVPLHELLHAFGCTAAGGEVQELQIRSLYGGRLLEWIFPFVRAGGDHAGRLTRFDTRGSDLTYLVTVLAPYIPTILGAFTLLRAARARKNALLLAAGVILAFAPALSLPGDLYEAGSILVTSPMRFLLPRGTAVTSPAALRHDDLLALLGEFPSRFPESRLFWGGAIAASAFAGALVGGAILALSRILADQWTLRGYRNP